MTSNKPPSLPTKATLKDLPLHRVLLSLYNTKQSGLLVIESKERKKAIFIDSGNPRGCRSNIKSETLGAMLIKLGEIDQPTLNRVLKECEDGDGFPLGGALVAKELLSPERLAELLETQLKQRLFDLFTWEGGSITLRPYKKGMVSDNIPVSISTPALILAGLMHAAKHSSSESLLDGNRTLRLVPHKTLTLEVFQFSGPELRVIHALDNTPTLAQLLQNLQQIKMDANQLEAFMVALLQIGLVEYGAVAKVAPSQSKSKERAKARSKADGGEFTVRMRKELAQAEGKNYFELLGISQAASEAEIRKVYFQLAKEFHPDRLRKLSDQHLRRNGEVLFAKISEAYNTLVDANKRKEYLASLEIGSQDATEQAAKILESEALFQKARGLIRQGEFRVAKGILDKAAQLHPEDPEISLYLGWARYKVASASKVHGEMQAAKALIEKYKDGRPNLDAGYFFLGQIAKLEGNLHSAEQMFVKTMDINPRNHEAERELRLMDRRREKTRKGIFKKEK